MQPRRWPCWQAAFCACKALPVGVDFLCGFYKIGETVDDTEKNRQNQPMKRLPSKLTAYYRTAEFDEASLPEALQKDHRTKQGVWAKIVVLEGKLEYTIKERQGERAIETVVLSRERYGVVEPTTPHHVKPLGAVRCYVEFYQ